MIGMLYFTSRKVTVVVRRAPLALQAFLTQRFLLCFVCRGKSLVQAPVALQYCRCLGALWTKPANACRRKCPPTLSSLSSSLTPVCCPVRVVLPLVLVPRSVLLVLVLVYPLPVWL